MPGPKVMCSSVVRATFQKFLKKKIGCLVAAVDWMCPHKFFHLDLKPENILVHNGIMFMRDFRVL